MKTALVLSLCLIGQIALSQISSGTLIVTREINGKLIVAADSYGAMSGGESPRNDQCKIAAFKHQFVFASSGAVEYSLIPGPIDGWKNSDEARLAVEAGFSAAASNRGRIDAIADAWGKRLAGHWAEVYATYPNAVIALGKLHGPALTMGFFATVDNGRFYSRFVNILFDPANGSIIAEQGESLSQCVAKFCAFGFVKTFNELRAGLTKKAETSIWTPSPAVLSRIDRETLWVIRLVDLAIAYEIPGNIGTPIDVLELWANGGIHWVARKNNCRENED